MSRDTRAVTFRAFATIAALGAIAAGLIHLDRWNAEYHEGTVGTLFLVEVGLSAVFALWLLVRPSRLALLGVLALELGTLAAFAWTRQHELFGFTADEFGTWEKASVAVEAATALVAVVALAVAPRRAARSRRQRERMSFATPARPAGAR